MGAMVLAVSLFPMGACIGTAVATAAYAARRAQTVDVLLGLLDGDDAGGLADGGSGGGGGDGRASGVGAPLSLSAALAFPFVASAALLFMFFFYAGISALLAVVVTLSSAMALSYLFFPALDGVMGRGGGGWSRLPASPGGSPSSSALLGAGGATAAGLVAGSSRRRGSGGGGGSAGGGGSSSGSGNASGPAAAAVDAVVTASARCGAALPSPSVLATALLVAASLSGWLMTGHWALNNLLGVAQCVLFVSLVRVHAAVTSLKVCTLLLAGLFVYDVFWVFASAHLFGTNVMVAVATQDATNPVASAAAALHLPVAPVARLALPVKLVFPTGDGGGLMLGLGDIFVPGLLLGLVLAFDTTTAAAAAATVPGAPATATASATVATRRGGGYRWCKRQCRQAWLLACRRHFPVGASWLRRRSGMQLCCQRCVWGGPTGAPLPCPRDCRASGGGYCQPRGPGRALEGARRVWGCPGGQGWASCSSDCHRK